MRFYAVLATSLPPFWQKVSTFAGGYDPPAALEASGGFWPSLCPSLAKVSAGHISAPFLEKGLDFRRGV